jgi:alpha-N-arabinofuranosidase
MEPTTITLHTRFQISEVDPRVFGGFLEHMGRAVYEGKTGGICGFTRF